MTNKHFRPKMCFKMCNHYLWNTAKNSLCWEIPREKTDGILKAQQFLGQATVKGALSQYFFVQSDQQKKNIM